ncbi:hypothetical protein chiPu_0029730, partial [Chiloscyllium punctatum]|nr:hypothetical protein [Chiloscyllium punctatum]
MLRCDRYRPQEAGSVGGLLSPARCGWCSVRGRHDPVMAAVVLSGK